MKHMLNRKKFFLFSAASTVGVLGCGGGGDNSTRSIASQDGRVRIEYAKSLLPSGVTLAIKASPQGTAVSADQQLLNVGYDLEFTIPTRAVSRGRTTELRGNFTLSMKIPTSSWGDKDLIYIQGDSSWGTVFLHGTVNPQLNEVQCLLPYEALVSQVPTTLGDQPYIVRFRLGMARIIQSSRSGSVAPKFLTWKNGSWQNDNWGGIPSLDGRRIAVIVPGTFTRRNAPLQEPNDRFISLATWLSVVQQGTILNASKPNKQLFDNILAYEYDDIKSGPDQSGEVLGSALRNLLNNGAQVYIFAHSQGGLVARWAIEKSGAYNTSMLVMIGVPNQGIPSDFINTTEKILDILYLNEYEKCTSIDRKADICFLHATSPAMEAMETDSFFNARADGDFFYNQSNFLKKLNTPNTTPNKCAYYAIVGKRSVDDFLGDIDNDWTNSWTAFINVLSFGDESDGTVMRRSSLGEDINWNKIGRGILGRYTWPDKSHSFLPKVSENLELASILEKWIQDECIVASTSVEVR